MKRIIALVLAAVSLFIFTSCSASLVNFKYEKRISHKPRVQKARILSRTDNYEPFPSVKRSDITKRPTLCSMKFRDLTRRNG